MSKIKPFVVIAAIGAVLAVVAFLVMRVGCREEQIGRALQLGDVAGIPPGWHQASVVVAPVVENPFRKSIAGKKTEKLPPGSELVEVKTPTGEIVQIAILPGGEVIVPDGYEATVYKKPPSVFAFEARPWIGAGAAGTVTGITPAGAAGVDVVRAFRFHGGPGVVASRDNVAGVVAGAYNPWRNVDVRVGGGYGTAGACAFVGVGVGIVKSGAP